MSATPPDHHRDRPTGPALLCLDRVSYRHPDADRRALVDVDLRIGPGELVLLAGASGSGKSTLLHAAAGLAPHHLGGTLAGHVTVGGVDTRDARPADLARRVGTVLQEPETQVVLNGVRAELALPLELRGAAPVTVARAVEEVALALGIERLLDRPVHELSGGELQRVALGAALAAGDTGPGGGRLLLLDEPTSQLDPVAGDELLWLLRRLNEEHGTAVLLAEHRLDRCLHHADRVVAMDAGRIVWDGDPSGFLAWAGTAAPGLLPPAARLFAGAGRAGGGLPVGVRDARRALDDAGVGGVPDGVAAPAERVARNGAGQARWRPRRPRRHAAAPSPDPDGPALRTTGLWLELRDGPAVLRGIDLTITRGERVALLGRNGAGKSTLLRTIAGLQDPTRGRIRPGGRIGLLTQRPGDYLLHDRVGDETTTAALRAAGVDHLADRHPRDVSGGERQRVALAVVLGGQDRPALVGLDEPTRGMDAVARAALRERLDRLAADGTAVIVATHDVEFAAEIADRVLLLADGRLLADAPAGEVLSGGWYFGTQTARILGDRVGPGEPTPLTPRDGAAWLAAWEGPATPGGPAPPTLPATPARGARPTREGDGISR
ncbi:MAG: ABC transporter ATP-binding protein [Solirubrobacteraceae bacterium]